MIQFLLSLFKPFRGVIASSGVDYKQFIHILELKLTIDNRKASKKSGGSERSLIMQSLSRMAVGLIFAYITSSFNGIFTFYYVMHTIIMVMMAMMIISEFTTVLFDTSENMIIQPLPINGNTISFARNAHVFLYLILIALSFSLASLIMGAVKFGIASALLFLVTVFFNVLFTLFLSNILYLGLMQIASGERLKNILMYFQIAIAVFFMAAYQFGLNLIDKSDITNMLMHVEWYTYLIPSAVFAGFIESIATLNFSTGQLLFIFEAMVLPILAMYISSRFLTPIFNRKLLQLESGDKATKVKSTSGKTTLYYRILENIFTKSRSERASFQLVWRLSANERLFKQSFFPSLAYVIIMIVLPIFKKDFNIEELQQSDKYILFLYSFILISFALTNSLMLGNNPNAVWIFKFLPENKPSEYFKGFIKAAFLRFFLPFYSIVSVGVLIFWGFDALPDIIIAWMAIYFSTMLAYFFQDKKYPFSQINTISQGGEMIVKVLGLIILAAIMGWGHYFLIQLPYIGHIVLISIYSTALFLTEKYLAKRLIKWGKIHIDNPTN